MIEVIGARPYEEVRDACLLVSSGLLNTTDAARIAEALPQRCVLLPAPSHDGQPRGSLLLARAVAAQAAAAGKEALLRPLLVCDPHRPTHGAEPRKDNHDRASIRVRFRHRRYGARELENLLRLGYKPVIVDNVVDTGATARAIMQLTGPAPVAAIGDTGRHRED